MNIRRARKLQIQGPDSKPCYGGDQLWFSSNTRAMGGCGSVAGANVLRALAQTDPVFLNTIRSSKIIPEGVKDAICSDDPSHENYSFLMTGVYETMGSFEVFPLNRFYDRSDRSSKVFTTLKSTFGLTNVGFITGIIRFARKLGIDLKVRYMPAAFLSKEEARSFIKEGLKTSGAVVLLTCQNRHNVRLFSADSDLTKKRSGGWDSSIRSHFVTITDMDLDRLLITTWGKPGILDFNELAGSWRSIKAYEASLMYIVPSTRKEATSCMLGAWKLFMSGIGHALIRR